MIGKTIKAILVANSTLTNLVPAAKMFPYVMNEDTDAPALVYMIDSVSPVYNKGGWAGDDVRFSIHSFAKDYSTLQSIASAVRGAFELNQTGSGTQSIDRIYLDGMNEGFLLDAEAFYNTLNFRVTVKDY